MTYSDAVTKCGAIQFYVKMIDDSELADPGPFVATLDGAAGATQSLKIFTEDPT